jgi:hypothetical protein
MSTLLPVFKVRPWECMIDGAAQALEQDVSTVCTAAPFSERP